MALSTRPFPLPARWRPGVVHSDHARQSPAGSDGSGSHRRAVPAPRFLRLSYSRIRGTPCHAVNEATWPRRKFSILASGKKRRKIWRAWQVHRCHGDLRLPARASDGAAEPVFAITGRFASVCGIWDSSKTRALNNSGDHPTDSRPNRPYHSGRRRHRCLPRPFPKVRH